ncbi:MAG: hypothetical protein CSA81_08875 [Acidobacteria bacterium]|nr:MAG: hypothetical protein CSA81_08875 [Acidobacteriota bacterium]
MTQILNLLRLIPKSGKFLSIGLILFGSIGFVYYKWGLTPAIFVAVAVVIVAALIFGYNQMVKASEKQSGKAFGKAIRNSQIGASRGEIKQAVGELGDKWQEAIGNFKQHELSLYELPWFMLVGEPQSGKSTTLKFSGLKFPIGIESISGGGGTRNCDWWFTEEGIILDTAGRFTFQETTATDAAEWNHFLQLLAKYRPYCPINGIILVIPATSLLGDDQATREQKARNISDKLHHIQRVLAIQFPVFVLITKSDAIYGFTEFFNKLSPDQQREMLGWSNPVLGSGFELDTFDSSFGSINKRIQQIRLRNLSRPQYSYDSNKTFIFPEEFETIFEPLRHYLSVIFEVSVYKTNLFFRGYYFTSGMQEGQPIIKACRNIVKKGSLSANLEKIFTKSRAFFIRDFYTQKVFPEQGLVQRAFQHLKGDRLKKRLLYSMNVLLLIMGALFVFFMHRSLTQRLDKPKAAITQTLQIFKDVEGDFFSSDESRVEVYRNLKNLQNSLSQASEGSYLLFLKGKQNQLTETLQDAFAYLYLDRVLSGLFNSTVSQLSQFSLKKPGTNSKEDLDRITAALAELNTWRYQVALGEETDFKPSIDPFLPLVMDPQWDNDLAKYRHELTLTEELGQWFQTVYNGSSDKVRVTLIRELARRSDTLFEQLHEQVIQFYLNQPEITRYIEKLKLIEEIEAQYVRLKEPSLTVGDFEDKLADLAPFFSDDKKELLKEGGDKYLTFNEIREKTIKATGDEFVSLTIEKGSPSKKDKKRQGHQRDTVQFINQLTAVDETQLKDPAKEIETPPVFPAEAKAFWTHIGLPYLEDYKSLANYSDYPIEDLSRKKNLEELFSAGSKRVGKLKSIFVTGVFNTTDTMQNPEEKERFKSIYDELNTLVRQDEMESFNRVLLRISQLEIIRAPKPTSTKWNPLVREYDRLTDSGMDYEKFFSTLQDFQDELTDISQSQMKIIYGNDDTPVDLIKTYKKAADKSLKSFSQAVQSLAMISGEDIAANRRKYLGNFREKSALLQLANLDEDSTPLTETHRRSLEAWSTRFIEAFQSRVGKAEVCPSCPGMLSDLKAALFLVRNHFPVVYKGTSRATSPDPGETNVEIAMASPDNLKRLFEAIEQFRTPTPQQAKYLKRRGLTEFFQDAVKWMDYVKKIQSGNILLKYKLTATNHPDSIARTFSFADLYGFYSAKRLGLNSPTFRNITKNANNTNEGFSAIFELKNETEGNMSRSYLKIKGSELELLAFILDSATVGSNNDTFDKTVPFLLNVNQKKLTGTFRFKLTEPAVMPPKWHILE